MNVSIRPWQTDDATALAMVINNKKVQDNLRDGVPFPYTEKDGAEFISAMLGTDPDSTFAFAITVDGKVAGSVGAFRQSNIHSRTAEMGYYAGEEYWGKGVCTAAVKLVCRYVFENSDIIRIYAEPFAHNVASCRVLEKAGFQYEGTLRSNAVKNGKVSDMRMYSLIKEVICMDAAEFEKNNIMKTLQYFFDGFDQRDGELVKKAFHPNAFLFSSTDDGFLQGVPAAIWCDNFFPFLKSHPELPLNQETCEKELMILDITGDVAIAKVEWRYSFLTMTDYYTLLRMNGSWHITSKVWNESVVS